MIRRNKIMRITATLFLCASLVTPIHVARADFWGGDIPLLAQIVANTLQELIQLRSILSTGDDTLGLLREVNEGIHQAMDMIQTMNRTFQPGVLSQYRTPEEILRAIEGMYGAIPNTSDAKMEGMTDQSVAEAIALHNQAFEYANLVDPEAEKIKDYARQVSPTGAARLTAQSLGVLIHVTNQVLRTNAAMLKMMSENLALQNRREKVNSEHFKMQYDGLSSAFGSASSMKDDLSLDHK